MGKLDLQLMAADEGQNIRVFIRRIFLYSGLETKAFIEFL